MRLRRRKSSHLVRDGILLATLLLSLGLMNSCDETGCMTLQAAPECPDFVEP
jgi:hypothetical protein